MEIDWDKEFDSLLRNSAQGETVSDQQLDDLDADEIAAFAENLLPPNARARVAAKLADSAHGRQILSNLILINETAEIEEKKAFETAENAVAIAPKIRLSDYFSRFFTFQTLGFVGAALSVVLIGTFAFVVLRSPQNSELAMGGKEKTYSTTPQSAMNANASSSNTASVANTATNAAPVYSANSAANMAKETSNATSSASNMAKEAAPNREITASNRVSIAQGENKKEVATGKNNLDEQPPTDKTPPMDDRQTELAKGAPPPAPPSVAENQATKPASETKPLPTPSTRLETKRDDDERARSSEAADGAQYSAKPKPSVTAAGSVAGKDSENDRKQEKLKSSAKKKEDTRTIGGKTFRRENGAWLDSAYNSQPTQNISRGSEEYKKLDSGLRSIAENLGGTVIIVWQGRAYRVN